MVFSSSTFLFLFLPIAIAGYYLLHPRYRNGFLLLISLAFYAWGEPKFVVVMIASILLNWGAAFLVDWSKKHNRRGKGILVAAVAANLALLFVFKYLNFTVRNINRIFPIFEQTKIVLPIGISFFTFQAISYVVDVYRGKGECQKNPLNVGLYISFFPQLIAGPIVRFETIAREIKERSTTWEDFCAGMERFLRGLFKKMLLSNQLAIVADQAFGTPYGELSVGMAWLGAFAYAFQIFFDFSGYSDMAIGLGRIFGFHFDENFDYPYISRSVTEFWRRWHISLGTWFRDYVYFPLGGSRVSGKGKHIRNLLIVWLLTGIWHGASWNFLAWGLMYFVLLVVEKYIIHPERFSRNSVSRYGWQMVSMLAVLLGWVLFRAEGMTNGIRYGLSMLGIGAPLSSNDAVFYSREYIVVFAVAILCSTPVFRLLKERVEQTRWAWVADIGRAAVYAALLLFSVSFLVMGSHNPFIYFNF